MSVIKRNLGEAREVSESVEPNFYRMLQFDIQYVGEVGSGTPLSAKPKQTIQTESSGWFCFLNERTKLVL